MREWANRVAARLKLVIHKNYIADIPDMVDKIFDPKFNPVTTPRGSKKEITKLLRCVRRRQPRSIVMLQPESSGTLFLLSRVANKECNIIIVSDKSEDPLYEYAAVWGQKVDWVRSIEAPDPVEQVKKLLVGGNIEILYISRELSDSNLDSEIKPYMDQISDDGLIVVDGISCDNKLWSELKQQNLHAEIVEKEDPDSAGIGVIFCDKL